MTKTNTIVTDTYGVNWCYIKIPRTASKAYTSLFDEEFSDNLKKNKYYPIGHAPHFSLRNQLESSTKYFSVVRHPVTRFASCLRYIFQRQYTYLKDVIPHDTIHNMSSFLYEAFDRNCKPQSKANKLLVSELHWFLPGFFKTQVFWLGNDDIKIFKYENLKEFNDWISTNFQININKLEHINSIEVDNLHHLDFNDKEFTILVEYLFHEDFITFNYPLTYIT